MRSRELMDKKIDKYQEKIRKTIPELEAKVGRIQKRSDFVRSRVKETNDENVKVKKN